MFLWSIFYQDTHDSANIVYGTHVARAQEKSSSPRNKYSESHKKRESHQEKGPPVVSSLHVIIFHKDAAGGYSYKDVITLHIFLSE